MSVSLLGEGFEDLSVWTPVVVSELHRLLKGHPEATFFVDGFSSGFSLGLIKNPIVQCNTKVSPVKAILLEKLLDEVNKGRIVGPFNERPRELLMISPLHVIPKPGSDRTRMIFDLSVPHGKSVNDNIALEAKTVRYCSVVDVALWLQEQPTADYYMAKVDLTDAYRMVPIRKLDWCYLGIQVGNQYFADRCLPMGAASSCQLFQRISDMFVWIFNHIFDGQCIIFNYLDDFLLVSEGQGQCEAALNCFLAMFRQLGVTVSEQKTVWPTRSVVFLGLGIDTQTMAMYIPAEKVSNASTLLRTFLSCSRPRIGQWQSILGKLCHLSQVLAPGRTYLASVYGRLQGTLSQEKNKRKRITKEIRDDLLVWAGFLAGIPPVRQFKMLQPSPAANFSIATDACKSVGFGCVFGHQWFYGQWPDDWWTTRSIALLELFPIYVALHVWGHKFQDSVVLVNTDNEAIVMVLNKLYSKDKCLRVLLKPISLLCLNNNTLLRAQHLAGKQNVGPDLLSRGRISEFLSLNGDCERSPIALPRELLPANCKLLFSIMLES